MKKLKTNGVKQFYRIILTDIDGKQTCVADPDLTVMMFDAERDAVNFAADCVPSIYTVQIKPVQTMPSHIFRGLYEIIEEDRVPPTVIDDTNWRGVQVQS